MSEEEQPHAIEETDCLNCGHHWVAVYPVGTRFIECSNCGFFSYTDATFPENISIVIHRHKDLTSFTVNRKISRLELMGLLLETLGMAQSAEARYISPEECRLKVALSILSEAKLED